MKYVLSMTLFPPENLKKTYDSSGGRILPTILLLWEAPNHRILETLTSTDKLLRHVCPMGNRVTTIFGRSRDVNRKKGLQLKRHTVWVTEKNSAST